jgi:hypothetical protein
MLNGLPRRGRGGLLCQQAASHPLLGGFFGKEWRHPLILGGVVGGLKERMKNNKNYRGCLLTKNKKNYRGYLPIFKRFWMF